MSYSTKFGRLAATIVLFSLSGCAQDLERMTNDLRALNQETSRQTQSSGAPGFSMARNAESAQSTPTQMIAPKDKSVAAAMDAAMPNISKVISLHRCMKSPSNMRMLNFHATPGRNFETNYEWNYPNGTWFMKYHDRNQCVAARIMDQWSMPALNALRFRVVYFAEDSGETVNFQYEFKRAEDGYWKLDSIKDRVA